MNEEYLWDRSSPPDPEIERLEQTLAPLRYRLRPELVRPERSPRRVLWAAAAAAMVLCGISVWQLRIRPAAITPWQVDSAAGGGRSGVVRAGQWVRTGQRALTLQADALGKVDVGPYSELRAAGGSRLMLNRGQVHAFIWAPPREFVVDTPSARAVDLGCEYTLNVDDSGNGLLRVSLGWVAFKFGENESFIPAGAACVTRKRQGPGIPYYEDAAVTLRKGVKRLEDGDGTALAVVLESARAKDGLTLWHLLTRGAEADRAAAFDRFRELVELPADVTRDGVLRRDPEMINKCWDALNLENTQWWRGWEREWK
jgi:hypothetical protein